MGLAEQSREFIAYVERWQQERRPVALSDLVAAAGGPEQAALFCVDVTNGFCRAGPLASPRVGSIVAPIVHLFEQAYRSGVRRFILPQDAHPQDSPQFSDFGPHCVAGTEEAQTVQELLALPFASEFIVVPKRSIASDIGTDLPHLLEQDGLPKLALAVGDCTDLCLYQLALYLKLTANASSAEVRVVVPMDCVETYDLPMEVARQVALRQAQDHPCASAGHPEPRRRVGAMAHAGDFFHAVFLYHMALNGIEIVARIE